MKIPATKPGLAAIEDCIARGKSINVTLIFSLQRYAEVAEAYLRGLERLVAGGGDPGAVLSVASFFVSRVDSEADKRLEAVGRTDLQGKLAVANAKLAYQHYLETFAGPRWEFLAGKGARPQRCLWASTSTKNPSYPDTIYVAELVGPDVVNTMPLETIEAFQDHGVVEPGSLTPGSTRRGSSSPTSQPPVSTTTMSRTRSRPRACRSSPTRSTCCWPGSRPSAAHWPSLADATGGEQTMTESTVRRSQAPAQAGALRLAIFGASGDLTRRKLFPALYALAYRRLLPERFSVVGVARSEQTTAPVPRGDEAGREAVRPRPVPSGRLGLAAKNLRYIATEFDSDSGEDSVAQLLDACDGADGTEGNRRLLPGRAAAGVPDGRRGDRRAAGAEGLDARDRGEAVRARPRVRERS